MYILSRGIYAHPGEAALVGGTSCVVALGGGHAGRHALAANFLMVGAPRAGLASGLASLVLVAAGAAGGMLECVESYTSRCLERMHAYNACAHTHAVSECD